VPSGEIFLSPSYSRLLESPQPRAGRKALPAATRGPIHGEGPARMIETLSPKKELEDLQAGFA